MMDCTDRHDRFFLRLMSKNVMLYTEMVATKSAIHGDRKKILGFNKIEKPLALQVGGSNQKELIEVCKIAEDMGYDEININLGCPSKKVQKNKFGACLIKEPELVADCISSMVQNCKIPVTAKTRIGFDNTETFEYLNSFVKKISEAGCKTIILHARRAILKGLTPKENLKIPKLNYPMVYEIKKSNKDLEIILNGGITNSDQIIDHLNKCDGVMIGRAIYQNPYFLADIEKEIFKNETIPSRQEVIENLIPYVKEEIKKGTRLNQIMRHTLGLFHGQTGSSFWKRYLSENMCVRDADVKKIDHIMDKVKFNPQSISAGQIE